MWHALKSLKAGCDAVSKDVFSNVEPLSLPVIDVNIFLNKDKDTSKYQQECDKLADALHLYGCAVIRDPRVEYDFNNTFLDMMERYFSISDGQRGNKSNSSDSPSNIHTQNKY